MANPVASKAIGDVTFFMPRAVCGKFKQSDAKTNRIGSISGFSCLQTIFVTYKLYFAVTDFILQPQTFRFVGSSSIAAVLILSMPRVLGAVRAAATINAATCNAADFSSSVDVFMA
jgi:hypothetical protein